MVCFRDDSFQFTILLKSVTEYPIQKGRNLPTCYSFSFFMPPYSTCCCALVASAYSGSGLLSIFKTCGEPQENLQTRKPNCSLPLWGGEVRNVGEDGKVSK